MYAFNDMVHLKAEIEGWMENPNTGKPPNKNDHLISALSFFASRYRIYQGKANWNEEDYDDQSAGRTVSPVTGW